MSRDPQLTEAVRSLESLILASEHHRHVVARSIGLGTSETQALAYLAAHKDAGQSALRQHLGLTTSAATSLVDRLEQKGVAERAPDPQDRRRTVVRLTDRGATKISEGQHWLAAALQRLSSSDLAQISTSMALVAADLRERAADHAAASPHIAVGTIAR